jgi:pyroglutamyl-peptidase
MAEKVILFTGYPPFGNHTLNPSGRAAEALDGREIAGYRVQGVVLPCDHKLMPPTLADWIEKVRPAAVIGSGLAFGDAQIRVERVGLNLMDFGATPDNGGHLMINEPILKDGPPAYFSTLPVPQIVNSLREAGIPAYLSGHAGGHLCNHFLYTASHLVAQIIGARPPVGFIHLPALPEQAAAEAIRDNSRQCAASMSFDLMLRALELVLQIAVTSNE